MAFVTDKSELKPGLILFRRGDVEHRMWYCRMKMPKADRYKTVSLKTTDIDVARDRALCRVALHQFATTIFSNPELGSHKYAFEIAKGLDADLESVLGILDKTLPVRAQSIKSGVESEFNELHSELLVRSTDRRKRIPIIDWSTAKIVGFQDPGSALCGLLSPVVNYDGSAASALLAEKDESGYVAPLDDMPASIRAVAPTKLPSTTTKILYLSGAAERIVRKWQLGKSLFDKAIWITKSGGAEEHGRVGCIERKIGTLELDLMAKELVWKAFSILCGSL